MGGNHSTLQPVYTNKKWSVDEIIEFAANDVKGIMNWFYKPEKQKNVLEFISITDEYVRIKLKKEQIKELNGKIFKDFCKNDADLLANEWSGTFRPVLKFANYCFSQEDLKTFILNPQNPFTREPLSQQEWEMVHKKFREIYGPEEGSKKIQEIIMSMKPREDTRLSLAELQNILGENFNREEFDANMQGTGYVMEVNANQNPPAPRNRTRNNQRAPRNEAAVDAIPDLLPNPNQRAPRNEAAVNRNPNPPAPQAPLNEAAFNSIFDLLPNLNQRAPQNRTRNNQIAPRNEAAVNAIPGLLQNPNQLAPRNEAAVNRNPNPPAHQNRTRNNQIAPLNGASVNAIPGLLPNPNQLLTRNHRTTTNLTDL